MLKFVKNANSVVLEYQSEFGSNEWIWGQLNTHGEVEVSRTFHFKTSDLINPPTPKTNFDVYVYNFRLAKLVAGYVQIQGRILDIPNKLHIEDTIELKRSLFTAERNISIFGRLSKILDSTDPIFIGGKNPKCVPREVFEELLHKFPNSYELNRYAEARVHTILSQSLDGLKDAQGRYESYLNKKSALNIPAKIDLDAIRKLEVEKYVLVRDLIADALKNKTQWSEKDWQQLMLSFLLLLFPKYIKVIENITVHDHYSDPSKKTNRFIDIGLIDSNGNLDLIEIKKPFENKVLRKGPYRGNSIPTAELSGSIMQSEKYLFHLSKWGVQGEKTLTKRYASDLPSGMQIKISNPKAIIILGRDQISGQQMSGGQLLDFELIKRKYSNVMDIITYDDLLRRLDNTIAALGA